MEPDTIVVKGAREHNLQDVHLELPRNRLICLTGVSGSGKSSLAFDTLHAEGQRRYIESLSSYARQFMGQMTKPDVDLITGLSPTISIQQKSTGWNPRSTVGTVTQIHDFLRVLFARVGTQHCTQCDQPISAQTRDQIVGQILDLPEGSRIVLLAPVVRQQKGEYRDLFEDMLRRGFARARVDGRIVSLSDDPMLDRNRKHNIEIVVDRLALQGGEQTRLAEAVENALELGEGMLIVSPMDDDIDAPQTGRRKKTSGDLLLSSRYACTACGLSFEPPSPQMFSFNSPAGMCMACHGLGVRIGFDPELMIPFPRKSFIGLAIEPMRTKIGKWRRHIYEAVAKHVGFKLSTPWQDLSPAAQYALLFGTGDVHLTYSWRWSGGTWRHGGTFEGVIAELGEKYRQTKSKMVRTYYEKYMRKTDCPECHGGRINPQALAVRLGGRTLREVLGLSIAEVSAFFDALELNSVQRIIAEEALKEIRARLRFLNDVGLHYLTLARTAPTLSGGESQRIRLASQIGAGLVGVLYVLDEPSIGLHARDNQRLLDSLLRLRDMGNTVIVVEHDEETMRAADTIVDFGPGPGVRGGHVVAHGPLDAIRKAKKSVTGRYLSGAECIEIPKERRPVPSETTAVNRAATDGVARDTAKQSPQKSVKKRKVKRKKQ